MITLSEALQAKNELERLQQAANLAPVLQAQADKQQSELRLEDIRKAILTENTKLYSDFQQAITAYRNELESVVNALKHLAQTLRNVFALRKRLTDNAQAYVNEVYKHNTTHLKQDSMLAVFNAENRINEALPGSLQFEPYRPNDPITGAITTILQHL